ncbi:electron transport complex subunit RsxB [Celerinatantimonas yamalensis]|uniref:Ion-translocating oxidoreductase complex subunit B n=1 Tax=Celerinatantimonas yamalensis TaxID=559956 RepID=A0ABW9G3B8_9GAMM
MITILYAASALLLLGLIFGAILGYASIRFKVESDPLADQVDQILPQTQCGQCGYAGCRPYAEAIAQGEAINKCPPGGDVTIKKLADLLGVEPPQDDTTVQDHQKKVAIIHEDACIGCTKCIQACPVDAIVGSTRQMHTVIASECTGCELCVAPCPTDCIEMRPLAQTTKNWDWQLNSIPVVEIESH